MKGIKPVEVAERISTELLRVGVRRGGVLLVHTSLKAMGYVVGGAGTVIRGLLQALGPDGTLLMPALSYQHVTAESPIFDVQRTPSNVGAIPEYFRTRPGTRRSIHPTHSVCGVGPLTDSLLQAHHLDTTPCGPHSPFHLLPKHQGQILMLGCGLKPNTSIHAIEELVVPPYLFSSPLTYKLVLADGQVEEKTYRPHNFSGWEQRYDRVEVLLNQNGLKKGAVLAAKVHLIEASSLWAAALAALEQNLLYLVEKNSEAF